MAIFEAESWFIAAGKHKEHDEEMHRWFKWVNEHQALFPEWKSVRYFEKHAAGDDSGRRMMIWEYDSFTDYEKYKTRRKDYEGPYKEYKENDPYYKGVFIHSRMRVEFWKDLERELWIE